MADNTSYKVYQWLIQINQATGIPTGVRKPNDPADPDYVPKVLDPTSCPLPIPPTFSWVENTYSCEQEELFSLIATYSGFSSPFGIVWDPTTSRFYVVDEDDVNGNFYWFNPDTITGYSDAVHIAGSNSDINTFVIDKENRRIIAAGDGSGGAKVLDFATNTITSLPYGVNTSAGSGRRTPITMSDTTIYAFCSVPNVVRLYDRVDLSFISEVDKTTIPSNSVYLINGYSVLFIGSEIWVGAASRSNSNIARYSSNFGALLGTISLPGVAIPGSPWTAAARYWQSHYYDEVNDRYYVADLGSCNVYVIDTITRTIINQYTIRNLRGKHFIDCGFSKNDLTGKIYLSVRCTDNLTDATANFKLYTLNSTTGLIENIFPDAQGGRFELRAGTTEQFSVQPGNASWIGGSWNTDGLIQKYQ